MGQREGPQTLRPSGLSTRCPPCTQDLPRVHKVIVWLGIFMDLISKVSLTFQIIHLAHSRRWLNFGFILGGYIISSIIVRMPALPPQPPDACHEGHRRRGAVRVRQAQWCRV